jgi:hypothetical protein
MDEDVIKIMTDYGLLNLPCPPTSETSPGPIAQDMPVQNTIDSNRDTNPQLNKMDDNNNTIAVQGGTIEQGENNQHLEVKFDKDFTFHTSTWYHVDNHGILTSILDQTDGDLRLKGTMQAPGTLAENGTNLSRDTIDKEIQTVDVERVDTSTNTETHRAVDVGCQCMARTHINTGTNTYSFRAVEVGSQCLTSMTSNGIQTDNLSLSHTGTQVMTHTRSVGTGTPTLLRVPLMVTLNMDLQNSQMAPPWN